jgi:hypothetical protein
MSRVLKQGANPPSQSPWFFGVIWRFCLFIFAVTISPPTLSASICNENRLSGECYRVNSSGQFWTYGAFLPKSRDTLFADYSGSNGFNLSRIRYKRRSSDSDFVYDHYLIQTKKSQLVFFREQSPFRSGTTAINLPTGTISVCNSGRASCFVFERTKDDAYYGAKFYSLGKARRHGYGLLVTKQGHLYVGYFRNDEPHGKGHLIYFNGEEYVGNFEDGEFSGNGTFYYSSGKKYVGQWRNNRMQGQGSVYNSDGLLEWSGSWTAGRKQSATKDSAIASSAPEPPKQASQMSPTAKHRLRLLQEYLIRLGFLQGSPDGVPGPATKLAMRKLISDLPTIHHGSLNTMDYTDQGDLQAALETVEAYIAKPLGQCKINRHTYSLCFNSR